MTRHLTCCPFYLNVVHNLHHSTYIRLPNFFFNLKVGMVHNKSPPLTLNKFCSRLLQNKVGTSLEMFTKDKFNAMLSLRLTIPVRPLLFKLIIIPHRSEFNYHSAENEINYWFNKLEVLQGKFTLFDKIVASENTFSLIQKKYAVGRHPLRALHLSWEKQTQNKEHRSHFISLAAKKLMMHVYKRHI